MKVAKTSPDQTLRNNADLSEPPLIAPILDAVAFAIINLLLNYDWFVLVPAHTSKSYLLLSTRK
jgi:hypothetical protein